MSQAPPATETPTFSPIIVAWLVVAGVFAFCAFVVLSAFAPDLEGGLDGAPHALSRSAVGYAGLVRLLKAEGEIALISRREPARGEAPPALTVVTPSVASDGDALKTRIAQGRVLIILPKWAVTPDPANPGWVRPFGLYKDDQIRLLLKAALGTVRTAQRPDRGAVRLAGDSAPAAGMVTGPIDHLQTIVAAENLDPILSDPRGGVVLAATDDHRIYVLSDPDLLNTQGLKSLANARVASALIRGLKVNAGGLVFDVTVNGYNSPPSLLKLAFQPPFVGATLCLFAAALLMGLHGANRFGAPRRVGRAIALGKLALADNSAALIRLARREHRMAPRYLDLTREAVIKALGIGRLSSAEADAVLDRIAEQIGAKDRIADLTKTAAAAKTPADAVAVARDLHHWRLEMTREPQ
ncbi:MAG: hypothetical protein P4L64_09580 [Caulobacteraceae bacterium]|nr:hypothetical protein [Caulobacteraceae bacterium]